MVKPKFILLTTVPISLNFFKNQINALNGIYDVTLISSPEPLLRKIAERENVKFKGIGIKREISLFLDIISLISLILFFLKIKPQIIHCNTPKASLLGLIAGFVTRVPKRIYYLHGFRYEGATGLKRKILINMEKISCFCATNIIAVSNGVKDTASKEITSKKVNIIHNGSANGMFIQEFLSADYNIADIKNELGLLADDFVYGFVGRIVGDKGINELIEAFDQISLVHSNVKLLLVGRYEDDLDPLQERTKQRIQNNKHIIEVGFQKDVKKYLSVLDVLVSPSYREGFGLSLLEANLMGKPVIATDITGYNEIVVPGKTGFLIPKKDSKALYERMMEVYNNRAQLIFMKEDCIRLVMKKYDHQIVLQKALNYYKKLYQN